MHLIGDGILFRGLVHYCHGEKQGSMQTDRVLEKEQRVPHLDLQATGSELSHCVTSIYDTIKPTFIVTHFLQEVYAHPNKYTPPTNTTTVGLSFKPISLWSHTYANHHMHVPTLIQLGQPKSCHEMYLRTTLHQNFLVLFYDTHSRVQKSNRWSLHPTHNIQRLCRK